MFIYLFAFQQMNSKCFWQGFRKIISWTFQLYSTCGRWTVLSSGAMSSSRVAWKRSYGGLREWFTSSSGWVRGARNSPTLVYQGKGKYHYRALGEPNWVSNKKIYFFLGLQSAYIRQSFFKLLYKSTTTYLSMRICHDCCIICLKSVMIHRWLIFGINWQCNV